MHSPAREDKSELVIESTVIKRDSIVTRAPVYYSEYLDDAELILLAGTTDTYVSLTGSSLIIWDAIDKPVVIENLLQELSNTYDINMDDIEDDVVRFIADMHAKEVVIVIN